jgi:hypothetical protein
MLSRCETIFPYSGGDIYRHWLITLGPMFSGSFAGGFLF